MTVIVVFTDDVRVDFGLEGKVAVVTGASSGMGKAVSVAYASAGAHVLLVGRDEERLAEACADAGKAGLCRSARLDVTDEDAPDTLVKAALDAWGRLDILVHAAGVFLPQPFATNTLDDLDLQWRVNVRAPFAITKAAISHLGAGSSVIFISSIAGLVGFPGAVAYCATKGAVELMSKALTLEYGKTGVRFNCIAPGNIHTPMNAHLFADPTYEQEMLDATPSRRIGEVADIAGAAVFLASEAASYMFGSSVVIDGGWTAG
jgi:NAD(P)-dependent dehydrogenase (short-subunit alcohol dehydrogenase family)